VDLAVHGALMLVVLKLLQSLAKTLHSEGTPTQIAAGFALGAALGLTPLFNIHNILIIVLLAMLNVSFGAGLLAMALFAPLGFALDPLFDVIGRRLLVETPALRPLWTTLDNSPGLALLGFDNTVVVGSVVGWLALAIPIFLFARWAVLYYRSTLGERVRQTRVYHAIVGSQAYNVYRWFRP
jgi:uncharacterized protein (TIGR03546 family)